MKCISEELIHKYIDKEASTKEEAYIFSHIKDCDKCVQKIDIIRQRAYNIKKLIGLTDKIEIEIPAFKKPVHQNKTFYHRFKYIIYSASAACILIFFLFFFQKTKDDVEYIFSYDLEGEFNANLPVSEQEMVIKITDSEGKLTNF